MITIIGVAAGCLAGLIYSEKIKSFIGRLVFKPLTSSLFITVAVLQTSAASTYGHGILMGLALSWAGDVCLMFSSDKLFLGGLLAFLGAHICYAVVFFISGDWGIVPALSGLLLLTVGAGIYRWLSPNLGRMRGPVIAYMIVITTMLEAAMMLAVSSKTIPAGKWLVLGGATLFYFSDIWVARDKFVSEGFVNSAVGLPLYYTGQFCLAMSIGYI